VKSNLPVIVPWIWRGTWRLWLAVAAETVPPSAVATVLGPAGLSSWLEPHPTATAASGMPTRSPARATSDARQDAVTFFEAGSPA
jgi:hypothetical protein